MDNKTITRIPSDTGKEGKGQDRQFNSRTNNTAVGPGDDILPPGVDIEEGGGLDVATATKSPLPSASETGGDDVPEARLICGLTNFHYTLFFGMVGFFLFWLGLLLRIYLPHEYFS